MSQLEPILWYVLHTQLMAGVTTWYLYVFPGENSGYERGQQNQSFLLGTGKIPSSDPSHQLCVQDIPKDGLKMGHY